MSEATVRPELENLGGDRYTDMFTLLKVNGEWQIMNEVLHLHAESEKDREAHGETESIEVIVQSQSAICGSNGLKTKGRQT